jgi:hypothetical protein
MTKSGTSDSIGWGMSPSTPTPGFADYNWWSTNVLSPEDRQIWREICRIHAAKTSHEQFELYKTIIRPGKSTIGDDPDVILARPIEKIGDFGQNPVFCCQKWNAHLRRRLVYLPGVGFCGLIGVIEGENA